ncbi:MAG: MiaB/RimO family radical SAM methylthiotransferase, partial [Rickettsiaceae bacterium]|nr:MiaB/RimO family radical SAM methylthiotransferase [Rickettsiaceae bacterium]
TNPELFATMTEVDKVMGNEEKLHPQNYLFTEERVLVNDIMSVTETAEHMISHFDGRSRAFVQVQNGCNHRCTFCIIPYGRGNSRSVPMGGVFNQVKKLVQEGFKEIVLTGVDVTSYGPDLPGSPTFAQMIRRLLAAVPELPRLRLSSIDVAEIDSELFDLFANEKRMMPHLHISLQAGDNMILKRMKRRHDREQVIDFCTRMRKARPDMAFGADIIAGFPTETDEMFENTRRLISEAGVQYLHVFPYSERDGTPAARMPQVPKSVRQERARVLREEGDRELQRFMQKNLGRIADVIMEKDGYGHSENFISVKVLGITEPGQLAKVKLTSVENGYMIGELV